MQAAAEKLLDEYYPSPYDLIVQPSAFMATHTLIANTGISQIEKIKELIGGNIYVSSQLKAADGDADLCVAQDLYTFYMQTLDMNHHFKVFEAVVPRIKRPAAICEITSIT